jgi:dihydroorotate dehydrogenase
VNLGANKDSIDRIEDYVVGLQRLGGFADYVTINVSSPNTPGLRALQGPRELDDLLNRLDAVRKASNFDLPMLLKIAPDLAPEDLAAVAEVALGHSLAGIVASNTTIDHREGLRSKFRSESGGLSGRPLFRPATAVLAEVYRRTQGRILLIGVGGIAGGGDAYEKICAGATLLQLYTALIYEGPGLIDRIKRELAARLRVDGFASIADAVGCAVR